MKKLLLDLMKQYPNCNYRLRYSDYEKDVWTVPVLLTQKRIEVFADDKSLVEVEIFTPSPGCRIHIIHEGGI